SGYVGVLSYDEFSRSFDHRSQIYRVVHGILFDAVKQECWVVGDDLDAVDDGLEPARDLDVRAWTLEPHASVDDYVGEATRAIEEIREGRFYQINLLRYFSALPPLDAGNERDAILGRLVRWGGPMSCLISTPELELVSFSPERFLCVTPTAKGLRATVNPIKGTMPRGVDSESDRAAAEALLASEKDKAELHMIVDLMR